MISTENKEVKNFHTHGLYRPKDPRHRADHPDEPRRQRADAHGLDRRRCPVRPSLGRAAGPSGKPRMSDMVLWLSAGSASIKFEVFEVIPRDELQLVFSGHFEGIRFRSHLTTLISCDRVHLH